MVKSIMDDVDEGKPVVDLAVKINHFAFNNVTRMLFNKRYEVPTQYILSCFLGRSSCS
jgi:hypothetical protein